MPRTLKPRPELRALNLDLKVFFITLCIFKTT